MNFTDPSPLFQLPRLARIEVLSNYNVPQLSALCKTSRRAALAFCGQGEPRTLRMKDGKVRHVIDSKDNTAATVVRDEEVLYEVWLALLQRDYGLSRESRYCTAFSPYERKLVAESMQRYDDVKVTKLERLRRLRRLYQELYTMNRSEPFFEWSGLYFADGIVVDWIANTQTVCMSSIVDMISAKLSQGSVEHPHWVVLLEKNSGPPSLRLYAPHTHGGAYIVVGGLQPQLIVCRKDDFFTIGDFRFAVSTKIYVDARNPSTIYFSEPTSDQGVLAVDIDAPAPAVRVVQPQNLPFVRASDRPKLVTDTFFCGQNLSGDAVVRSARADTILYPTLGTNGSGSTFMIYAAKPEIFLAPVVKPDWPEEQNERFETHVLWLVSAFDMFFAHKLLDNESVTPPLSYHVPIQVRVRGLYRIGRTTLLFTGFDGKTQDTVVLDWQTGRFARFDETARIGWFARNLDFPGTPFGNLGRPVSAGHLWAYPETFETGSLTSFRLPAAIAKVSV